MYSGIGARYCAVSSGGITSYDSKDEDRILFGGTDDADDADRIPCEGAADADDADNGRILDDLIPCGSADGDADEGVIRFRES